MDESVIVCSKDNTNLLAVVNESKFSFNMPTGGESMRCKASRIYHVLMFWVDFNRHLNKSITTNIFC